MNGMGEWWSKEGHGLSLFLKQLQPQESYDLNQGQAGLGHHTKQILIRAMSKTELLETVSV